MFGKAKQVWLVDAVGALEARGEQHLRGRNDCKQVHGNAMVHVPWCP